MELIGGLILIYLIYFFVVRNILHIFDFLGLVIGWLFTACLYIWDFLWRAVLFVLRKSAWLLWEALSYVFGAPWDAFHKHRLGEKEYYERLVRKMMYGAAIIEKKRKYAYLEPRFLIRLRWEWWALRMAVLGACCAREYDEEMLEAQQRAGEEKKRRWREEKAQQERKAREDADRERKAQQDREQRQQREKNQREKAGREEKAETKAEAAQRAKASDPFARAINILGLKDNCTRKEFNAAYRIAMMEAHPDAGGEHHDALAVNWARDVVMKRKGWQ